jgi:zinc/manganese transport system substrate-binding protein
MLRYLALLLLPLALARPAEAASALGVVAAESVYGEVAARIGGSHVQVTSILANPDQDPHLFEASPSTARQLADAQVVIYNGLGYDAWMDKLLSAAHAPDQRVIVAADLVGAKPGANPHLWYDPPTLPALATALAAEFTRRDPADAAEFAANLARFRAAMQPIAAQIAAIRQAHSGTRVTATEPVFAYMASALGLVMLNSDFQAAVMNETEPSPSEVAAFEQSLGSHGARILLYNAQVTDPTTARLRDLATKNGVPVVGVTETEPAGVNIETWFSGELDTIGRALEQQPAEGVRAHVEGDPQAR